MKKITKVLLFTAALTATVQSAAYAQGVFLCMRGGESTAVSVNGSGALEYMEMTDSNGIKVFPQISVSGNTYLPFRFICETAGLKDSVSKDKDIEENSFRFTDRDYSNPQSTQKIELNFNGNYVSHNVGEEFTYEAAPGDVRSVSIYNINGSLYFPMTYMAKLTGSQTFWNGDTRDIIFAGGGIDVNKYMDENCYLRWEEYIRMGYNAHYNNLHEGGEYISYDGSKMDLGEELKGTVKSVARINNTIVFTDQNKNVMLKNGDEITPLDFCADTLIACKNKIYGIESESSKAFKMNQDGGGFEYISDRAVYNLILREYKSEKYLYYIEADNRSTLHMMKVKNGDDYTVEITDYEHNNLLGDIKQLVVADDFISYTDSSDKLHKIDLPDPIEEFEIARINDGGHKSFDMNVWGMNYNTDTKTLYIKCDDGIYNLENDVLNKTDKENLFIF